MITVVYTPMWKRSSVALQMPCYSPGVSFLVLFPTTYQQANKFLANKRHCQKSEQPTLFAPFSVLFVLSVESLPASKQVLSNKRCCWKSEYPAFSRLFPPLLAPSSLRLIAPFCAFLRLFAPAQRRRNRCVLVYPGVSFGVSKAWHGN
jgi:hypothetical protein